MDIKIQNCKNNSTIYNTKDWVEYTDEVKKALEKQLPKTPMQNFYNEGDYNWECVNCGEVVYEGQYYCHCCGQKLLE